MRYLIITLFLSVSLFAITPFSLEGFKEANVKVLSKKNKLIKKEFKAKLLKELKSNLIKTGIKTSSENYSNFLLKIETIKLGENIIVNMSIFIVEDVYPARDRSMESMGITYKKSDFFETTLEDFETDVYESAFDYLLFDFIEQYKEENS